MTMHDAGERIERGDGFITLCEPAVGAGAMVIAAAEAVTAGGHNHQRHMHVTAVDVDTTAAHGLHPVFAASYPGHRGSWQRADLGTVGVLGDACACHGVLGSASAPPRCGSACAHINRRGRSGAGGA